MGISVSLMHIHRRKSGVWFALCSRARSFVVTVLQCEEVITSDGQLCFMSPQKNTLKKKTSVPERTSRTSILFLLLILSWKKVTRVNWVRALAGYRVCLTSPPADFKIAAPSHFVLVQVWVHVSVWVLVPDRGCVCEEKGGGKLNMIKMDCDAHLCI